MNGGGGGGQNDLPLLLCKSVYIVEFEKAVENNRFSKSLISRKMMQFQEN